MTADVAIVANGGANIASLRFALDRLGASSELTSDPVVLRRARRVILPGVGAAGDAMARLRALQLDEVIPTLTQPVLGICLGMQLLFESSDEDDTTCLGLIPARVTRLVAREGLPVPHMGWNRVEARSHSPLLRGLEDAPHLYFVHSYAAPLGPWTVATTGYGTEFASVVQWRNFSGAQCHPERSSQAGRRLLANFLELQ
ncbi:MAG TPA: imidazole glycerol phosphate synthase subunit HisH [Steroidobacteraceae bacterium]|nr:imidazole glycerol phosphate synthase subunit HisH [Steroidobacteraceae bacterium]